MISVITALAIAILGLSPLPAVAQAVNSHRAGLQTYVPAKQVVQLVDRYEAQKRTLIEWLKEAQAKCPDPERSSR